MKTYLKERDNFCRLSRELNSMEERLDELFSRLTEEEITLVDKYNVITNTGFHLRDDQEIGVREDEAYSLFYNGDDKHPYQRVWVYAGSFKWAIEEAFDTITNKRYTLICKP